MVDLEDVLAVVGATMDGFHTLFMGLGLVLLVAEGALGIKLRDPLNTDATQREHGAPADHVTSNLEAYWTRVMGTFHGPLALLSLAGLVGLLTNDQRELVWMFGAMHHTLDGGIIHGFQLIRPTPGTAHLSADRHRKSMIIHFVLAALLYTCAFLRYPAEVAA